jgi:hypothetical protein
VSLSLFECIGFSETKNFNVSQKPKTNSIRLLSDFSLSVCVCVCVCVCFCCLRMYRCIYRCIFNKNKDIRKKKERDGIMSLTNYVCM